MRNEPGDGGRRVADSVVGLDAAGNRRLGAHVVVVDIEVRVVLGHQQVRVRQLQIGRAVTRVERDRLVERLDRAFDRVTAALFELRPALYI